MVFISLFILADTTYLMVNGVTGDPLWFDMLAGSALVGGVGLGYYYRKWLPLNRGNEIASAS